jgi:hypothetical protein
VSKQYNHAFDVAFSIVTDREDAEGITAEQFTQAVLQRVLDLNKHDEWNEAVGAPFDTFEVEE